jgi:hypothetical protein
VARIRGAVVHTRFRRDNDIEMLFGGTILEFSGGIWENCRTDVQTPCFRSVK